MNQLGSHIGATTLSAIIANTPYWFEIKDKFTWALLLFISFFLFLNWSIYLAYSKKAVKN